MAQSLNKTVELHTTGVSYMAIGGKVGKFLIGDVYKRQDRYGTIIKQNS